MVRWEDFHTLVDLAWNDPKQSATAQSVSISCSGNTVTECIYKKHTFHCWTQCGWCLCIIKIRTERDIWVPPFGHREICVPKVWVPSLDTAVNRVQKLCITSTSIIHAQLRKIHRSIYSQQWPALLLDDDAQRRRMMRDNVRRRMTKSQDIDEEATHDVLQDDNARWRRAMASHDDKQKRWRQRWLLNAAGSYYYRANKSRICQLTWNNDFNSKDMQTNFDNMPVTQHGA